MKCTRSPPTLFGVTVRIQDLCYPFLTWNRKPAEKHLLQATLAALLEKLGVEHPYHTLYHLLALSNGARGQDGKRGRGALQVSQGTGFRGRS